MTERVGLDGTGPGSAHNIYRDAEGRLVVEWYDFGADAPYESANLIMFDGHAERVLAEALGNPEDLLAAIAARFTSWFEVKAFAVSRDIPFTSTVDFAP
jgi:hypothetical protein